MARVRRHVLVDVSPLRRSRDLRCLVAGQLLSTLGAQLTMVAVAYQVYALTRSSLAVGLVSLAQVVPLIAGALLGGSLADAADRRRVLLVAQLLTLLCSAGLAVNADTGPLLWPLFVLPAVAAGFMATTESGLSAILPNLVPRREVATVNAMFQALSRSARWLARPSRGCCWPARVSASSTGWTWPASRRQYSPPF